MSFISGTPKVSKLILHPDRLLPSSPEQRAIAKRIYQHIYHLPIISPHGHTDPAWFANNQNFHDAHSLIIKYDHYLLRLLYSQGFSMAQLGIQAVSNAYTSERCNSPREAWQIFAQHYYLFLGTPTGCWLDHVFGEIFGFQTRLSAATAEHYYNEITERLQSDPFRPRQIVDRFNIEFLSTTESPVDSLQHHQSIIDSDWSGRIVSSYRPDNVIDPEHPHFSESLRQFAELTNEDVYNWQGYLQAHRKRRADFIAIGTTATDHGHPTAATANLSTKACETLFKHILSGNADRTDAELFRAQMLTEMAAMSIDDGMVMQIHPGAYRNHNLELLRQYGPDKGADIPYQVEYTHALKPLLDRFGNHPNFTLVLFTMDEACYSRELAPLAGHYPCLRLGSPWWFHDSPEGMRRFRSHCTETAGFYNTVGFIDDTRALMSIPARHDTARRIDSGVLANLVSEHQISEDDAYAIAEDITYHLAKKTYKVGGLNNKHPDKHEQGASHAVPKNPSWSLPMRLNPPWKNTSNFPAQEA